MKSLSNKAFLMLSACLIIYLSHAPRAFSDDKNLIKDQKPAKKNSMGMGLNGVADWSTQMPFLDLMKQSREWNDWRSKQKSKTAIETDNLGWVTKLLPDQTAGTVFLVSPQDRDPIYTNYVVDYDGEGEIQYRWSTKKLTERSKPGRHIVKVGKGNNLLEIVKTNPQNPIRNISIVPELYYEHFKRGEIFNPDWISLISQFNTLRYMDWMSTNNSELSKWEERPLINDRTWAQNGVPLEIVAKLANTTNTNLWINVPHQANEDFINRAAHLLKHQVSKNLKIYVEHSNEVWNWQFKQAHYANKNGRKIFGEIGPAFMRWHGMRTAQICNIFKHDVFREDKNRIKCVLGVQTAWHGLEKDALECAGWKHKSNLPCYKQGFDHIAITSYFSGKLGGPNDKKEKKYIEKLIDWASSPEGVDLAFEQLQTGNPLRSAGKELKDYNGIYEKLKSHMKYWTSTAKLYGLTLIAYEGGQHITANGRALQNNKKMTEFYTRLNDDERMGEIYTKLLELWKDSGGELNVHFVDIGTSTKWGSWGARKYLDLTSPKWTAIENFNNSTECWWSNCSIPIETQKVKGAP